MSMFFVFCFFKEPATTESYTYEHTLSLHDALPSWRSSDVVALATKQASVLTFANVDTITEGTAFAGTHDGTVKDGDTLKLAGSGSFDDIADLDTVADLDSFGDRKSTRLNSSH